MNIQTPITPEAQTRRPGIPTAPPPPDLPMDLPGIAGAIETALLEAPPARMGQAYHAWFRRIPGVLLGVQEAHAVELAAERRRAESRQRVCDLFGTELAEARQKIVDEMELNRKLKEHNAEMFHQIKRRWHPVWHAVWGAILMGAGMMASVWWPLLAGAVGVGR